MRLSEIVPVAAGAAARTAWRLVAECDSDGNSELARALGELNSSERNGFLALFKRCAELGPRQLPSANCHEIDSEHSIYEFIKGNFRVAWFYDENKNIACSHLFRKSSQKTKQADKNRAIQFKSRYVVAKTSGRLVFMRAPS